MTDGTAALTRRYWKTPGEGTLFENFQIIRRTTGVDGPGIHKRVVHGIVILGGPHRIVTGTPENRAERKALSLDGADVVVIKTRAAPLSPALFGQALISRDLICQSWQPRSVRSVMICAEDDPELRSIVDRFPAIEVRLDPSQGCGPGDRSPQLLRPPARPGWSRDEWLRRGHLVTQELPRQMGAAKVESVVVTHRSEVTA